jgi:hypothetical protein
MAALTVPDTGLGATISGTGLVTTLIKSIGGLDISVEQLQIESLATTGYKLARPSDLRNNPEFTVEFYWTGAAPPIATAMIQTTRPYAGIAATITYPAAGSLQGSVFVKSFSFPSCEPGQIMTGKYTCVFDGGTAPSFTVA